MRFILFFCVAMIGCQSTQDETPTIEDAGKIISSQVLVRSWNTYDVTVITTDKMTITVPVVLTAVPYGRNCEIAKYKNGEIYLRVEGVEASFLIGRL